MRVYDQPRQLNRGVALTAVGRREAAGCTGRWPIACYEAWQKSRFAWCPHCKRTANKRTTNGLVPR